MDKRFLKDLFKVFIIVLIGGFIIGTLAHVFQIGQPAYVTNASQPCVITPITIPSDTAP
jgi:uncharacterized membrane protein YGL010W